MAAHKIAANVGLMLVLVAGGLLPASQPFAQEAASAPVSRLLVRDYVRDPVVSLVSLSPDGNKIAYRSTASGEALLIVQNLEGELLLSTSVEEHKIRDIFWIDNNFLGLRKSEFANIDIYKQSKNEYSQYIVFNIEKKKADLFGDNIWQIHPIVHDDLSVRSLGGEAVVYSGMQTLFVHNGDVSLIASKSTREMVGGQPNYDLYAVNLSKNTYKIVGNGTAHTKDWVVDSEGKPAFAVISNDETGNWFVRPVRGKLMAEAVLKGTDRYGAPNFIGLGKDPGTFLLSYRPDGESEYKLVALDANGVERDSGVNGFDLESRLLFDKGSNLLAGYALYEGPGHSSYNFFDPSLSALWRGMKKALSGQRLAFREASAGFEKILISVDGGDNSGSYMLLDRKTRALSMLSEERPQVTPDHMGPQSMIRYAAADGLEIEAVLTTPPPVVLKGRDVKNFPLIVLPHGGPQSYDGPGYDYMAQSLASRGYVVLQPNFRGSDGYGLDFISKGYGEWGAKMQTDLSDGVRHLAKQGLIDPKRVCIVGASYGGYAALAGVTLDPGVYRCASSIAGISDLQVMMEKERQNQGYRDPVTRYWTKFLGDPALWEARSPARLADRVTVPVLLIHGKEDTVVSFHQSIMMRDALKRAGKSVEYLELAGEDHWLSREETRIQAVEAVVSFVEKHNPPQ
ncbi:MAG: alpha/beta hydrolase family protein [Asticcacaulis sp.]